MEIIVMLLNSGFDIKQQNKVTSIMKLLFIS